VYTHFSCSRTFCFRLRWMSSQSRFFLIRRTKTWLGGKRDKSSLQTLWLSSTRRWEKFWERFIKPSFSFSSSTHPRAHLKCLWSKWPLVQWEALAPSSPLRTYLFFTPLMFLHFIVDLCWDGLDGHCPSFKNLFTLFDHNESFAKGQGHR